MPSSDDRTPPDDPHTADTPPPGIAIPAVIDPGRRFEDFAGFRESFLVVFTEPAHNTALRVLGELLYDMGLEYSSHWPHQPEGHFRAELRAGIADLRYAQGHLRVIAHPDSTPARGGAERHLARVALRTSEAVGKAADAMEAALGPWRGEDAEEGEEE
jgi:hypothetical protein